jgi:hypothetical protein
MIAQSKKNSAEKLPDYFSLLSQPVFQFLIALVVVLLLSNGVANAEDQAPPDLGKGISDFFKGIGKTLEPAPNGTSESPKQENAPAKEAVDEKSSQNPGSEEAERRRVEAELKKAEAERKRAEAERLRQEEERKRAEIERQRLALELDRQPVVAARELNARLLEATKNGQMNGIKRSLDQGADIDARDSNTDTALILAASSGNAEIIKLLITMGADINAKNKNGDTALILAASKGLTEGVKILIDKGADPGTKRNDGKTALMMAQANKHKGVVDLLEPKKEINDSPPPPQPTAPTTTKKNSKQKQPERGPAQEGKASESKSGDWVTTRNISKIYAEPKPDSRVLKAVNVGTKLKKLGKSGQWIKVTINDKEGFIAEENVE